MPGSLGVAGRIPAQNLTAGSTGKLITEVSAYLHRIARRRRRDRWWFLGGKAPSEDEGLPAGWQWTYPPKAGDPKTDVVGSRILFQGSAPGLSCVIRARWNIRPDRRPHLFVDFLSPSKDKKRVTIEVAIGEEHRPAGIFTKRKVRGLSRAERQKLWRIFRRPYRRGTSEEWRESPRVTIEAGWGEPTPGGGIVQPRATPYQRSRERLWVDPRSRISEEVAQFLVLFYLWRHELVALSPPQTSAERPSDEWSFILTFIGRWWRLNEEAEAQEVMNRLRDKYGFPDRWRGVLAYISRVIRDVRPKKLRREVQIGHEVAEALSYQRRHGKPSRSDNRSAQPDGPELVSVDEIAEALDVKRRTVYRWAAKRKLRVTCSAKGRLRFERPVVEEARRDLVGPRKVRLYLMEKLKEAGKKPEAAKKFIQRRLQSGKTLMEIGRELKEGRP